MTESSWVPRFCALAVVHNKLSSCLLLWLYNYFIIHLMTGVSRADLLIINCLIFHHASKQRHSTFVSNELCQAQHHVITNHNAILMHSVSPYVLVCRSLQRDWCLSNNYTYYLADYFSVYLESFWSSKCILSACSNEVICHFRCNDNESNGGFGKPDPNFL